MRLHTQAYSLDVPGATGQDWDWLATHRLRLTNKKDGWVLNAMGGISLKQFLFLTSASQQGEVISALGPTLGAEVTRGFKGGWVGSAELSYSIPFAITYAPPGTIASSGVLANRVLQLGVRATVPLKTLAPQWGLPKWAEGLRLGGALLLENRSVTLGEGSTRNESAQTGVSMGAFLHYGFELPRAWLGGQAQ
jgi:hypothetical protein